MRRIVAVLLFSFLVADGESVVMRYTVQMLPAKIVSALPGFVAKLPEGELTFASKDLVIGQDVASTYRFGLAVRQSDATASVPRQYLLVVDNDGNLQPIPAAASTVSSEQIVDGQVVRALLVALAAYAQSDKKASLATIGWRSTDEIVTVMFVPGRSDKEEAIVGGATSLGAEINYEVSRRELKLIRVTLAR